jgi:hypothetical protein
MRRAIDPWGGGGRTLSTIGAAKLLSRAQSKIEMLRTHVTRLLLRIERHSLSNDVTALVRVEPSSKHPVSSRQIQRPHELVNRFRLAI